MPKRGSDADSRIFFDELVSLGVSRLRATGAIRLEDRQILIPFGGRTKLIGVAHTVFRNGGSWSYFRSGVRRPTAPVRHPTDIQLSFNANFPSLRSLAYPIYTL
jgi:hypothetical protein